LRRRVIINWGISSFFGWGVYGLNLALNWARDPDVEPVGSVPVQPGQIRVDPLRQVVLASFGATSAAFQAELQAHAGARLVAGSPLLAGLDATFNLGLAAHGVALTGTPTLGTTFFETGRLAPDAVQRAAAFSHIITGSSWNEAVLREHGVERVSTILQGVDPTLFHPAPRARLLGDRFLVFSGGKLERRKGQDIVVAAFRIFAARHPDALLVTAWHSPWPKEAASLDPSGLAAPMAFDAEGRVDVGAWARANGLQGRVIDLGAVPNAAMPSLLREMDVAVFPNRCEGGTNLVAMECMACGTPTILSANTGHLDLIEDGNSYPLLSQRPIDDQPGWRESEVDEVVAALEQAYADRADAAQRGAAGARTLAQLPWSRTAQAVRAVVLAHA